MRIKGLLCHFLLYNQGNNKGNGNKKTPLLWYIDNFALRMSDTYTPFKVVR